MSLADQGQSLVVTEHGLLVAYGQFAKIVGLIKAIEQVSFKMKTVDHSPADKVAELLCHILAGGMHINELGRSAHPLGKDQAVAQAWGQQSFASASGVSHLLHAVSSDTVKAIKTAIDQVIEPYRRRILCELSPSLVVVDFDLLGLVVSDQAKTYEGAGFGYLGEINAVGKGYQFARAQLQGPKGAMVLGGFLHPGRTVSQHCLKELVGLVEAQLGRPRRRVECVAARLEAAEGRLAAIKAEVTKLAEKPKLVASRERLEREQQHVAEEIAGLRVYRDQLAAENDTNPNPPRRIILRLDGGFGDAQSLAWLYEQGYSFVVRAHHKGVAERLRKENGLHWEKVSKNGFIAECNQTMFGKCLYSMRLFACRQLRPEGQPERWSALVVTPDLDPKGWPVRRVGTFYNERQVIEAGIKEGKGIFASRHLPTRRKAGIELYEELVLLAQNLVRWFRRQFLGSTELAAAGVQELVRIGARSRAEVVLGKKGVIALTFVGDGAWRGITVRLKSQFAYQLSFPFLESISVLGAGH